jgi:hypothetical protein
MYNLIYKDMNLQQALEIAAQKTNYPLIQKWLHDAIAKVDEANTSSSALSKEIFVDDIAITSMARLWDVGKTEPIKIGKASPTEGALPSALYFALKYQHDVEEALIANAGCGGDSAARAMVIGMLLGMFIYASLSDVIQLNCVNLSVSIIIIIIIITTSSSCY